MSTKTASEPVVVKVEELGKWGFRDGNLWYSISQYNDVKLEDFKEGQRYKVVVSMSKAGKPYITEIVEIVENAPKAVVAKGRPKKTEVKEVVEKIDRGLTTVFSEPKNNSGLFTPKDYLILAQNSLGNVQSSQEWANLALTLEPDKRNEKFDELVDHYFQKALSLAKGA